MSSVVRSWVDKMDFGVERLRAMFARVMSADLHIGEYKISARSGDFACWTLCDGRSLNRSQYTELFEVIGTTFGGCGNTFNLPDFRGRVMGGVGQGEGSDMTNWTYGTAAGAETHAITESEMPAHTHAGTTDVAGSHSHATNASGGGGGAPGLCVADGNNTAHSVDGSPNEINLYSNPVALIVSAAGQHSHAFTTGSTGGGSRISLMQPTLFAANVFIFSGVLRAVA